MTVCPAYQSVDAENDNNRKPVNDYEENAYEWMGCDDVQKKNEDMYI